MKEINEFDILENTDQSVIDRLSEEFPPDDAEEKEKVFRMSEEKFNKSNSIYTETDEQVVSGVEVYKRPLWKKCLSTAAAAAILIGGTAGGIKAYRYFTDVPTVPDDQHEERRIAPFGDFSASSYKICDYSTEPLFKVSLDEIAYYSNEGRDSTDHDESDDHTDCLSIYGGKNIPDEKRQQIADLFNNYDYGEKSTKIYFSSEADTFMVAENGEEKTMAEYAKAQADAILESYDTFATEYEDMEAEDHFENMTDTSGIPSDAMVSPQIAPYFQCIEDNEIKSISIFSNKGEGSLLYYKFSYEEKDGEYIASYDTFSVETYAIDYDLFKSTINDILGAEESTEEQPTEQQLNESVPFDFTSHDFFTLDYDSKTEIDIRFGKTTDEGGEGQTGFTLCDGNVIPLEKRQQLNDFFNSYDWEETDEFVETPDFLCTYERFGLYSLSGNELMWCTFDKDSNVMEFTHFKIELVSDNTYENTDIYDSIAKNRYIIYKSTDESLTEDDICKRYKIDYDLFKNRITEILGYSLGEPIINEWSYFNKNWYMKTSESAENTELSDKDSQYLYDMMRGYNWELESTDSERISTEEAMNEYNDPPLSTDSSDYIILSSNYPDDAHYIVYLEKTPEKTIVRCNEYNIQGANIPGEEYINNIYNYSCDDTSIVQKLKEYAGR